LGARLAAQRPPQSSRRLSPFYWFTKNYPGRIWSYPGDIHSHLKEDLANHGFSEAELRGLSPIQMQKLHSADHEGLVSPGRPHAANRSSAMEKRRSSLHDRPANPRDTPYGTRSARWRRPTRKRASSSWP